MKQVLQSLGTGELEIADIPCPAPGPGQVLIRSRRTVISAGTERMLLEFGKASLLEKARRHPDRVKAVVQKMRTDGVLRTVRAVRSKLDQPIPLGYCNAGEVLEVGPGVEGLKVGDRVVSNGAHAEAVLVPRNLVARIPDEVSDERAAFAVLGAIALQGVRLSQPTFGERVVVVGLGLLGLLAVQLLRASGCRVLGIDLDAARLALAREFGAETVNLTAGEDPVDAAMRWTGGEGVDAVILTLAAKSSEPVHQAAQMCRKRGRIVLVGVTGLELQRADFYEKELSFQVSCSYGPGRYDPDYEQRGNDYPIGFVRWTAQRNFEAFLGALATGSVSVDRLISHRIPFDDAERAYGLIGEGEALGIVLEYATHGQQPNAQLTRRVIQREVSHPERTGSARLGLIGTGAYATGILLPAFRAAGDRVVALASQRGLSAAQAAKKFGIALVATDPMALIHDSSLNGVVVATRHESHAKYALAALHAGKHVFVEKPLALTEEDLDALHGAWEGAGLQLMVGFNRRFAPHVVKLKGLLDGVRAPKALVMTVNAGALPADHWTKDVSVGGGRLVGEGCHFIDLLRHLVGHPIVEGRTRMLGDTSVDSATLDLAFADGSIGTIHYLANGEKSFPKERLEVFAGGRIAQLDNFRTLTGYGWPGLTKMRLRAQDKGQEACVKAFVEAVERGGPPPIPADEIFEVSRWTLRLGNCP